MAERTTERWLIAGQVQGVGYRVWMVETATARGIAGWVRNLRGGQVEALVQGPADELARLFSAALDGPPMARVSGIERTIRGDTTVAAGFEALPTAPAPSA